MHQITTIDTVYTEYQTHRTTAHQSDINDCTVVCPSYDNDDQQNEQ